MYMYSLVAQPDLELALEGMKMLDYLINSLGDKISDELWDTLLKVRLSDWSRHCLMALLAGCRTDL